MFSYIFIDIELNLFFIKLDNYDSEKGAWDKKEVEYHENILSLQKKLGKIFLQINPLTACTLEFFFLLCFQIFSQFSVEKKEIKLIKYKNLNENKLYYCFYVLSLFLINSFI